MLGKIYRTRECLPRYFPVGISSEYVAYFHDVLFNKHLTNVFVVEVFRPPKKVGFFFSEYPKDKNKYFSWELSIKNQIGEIIKKDKAKRLTKVK